MNVEHPKWKQAFGDELEVVCGGTGQTAKAKRSQLVGLAFSGGGIRSATFNLGVLEALKDTNVLDKVDYLSTVSGGGYIGAWFSANCKRNPGWRGSNASWQKSISHLRNYSNYLAPLLGFFSADTWAIGMVWLRNTLLVQITVILAIAAALTFPRVVFPMFATWHNAGDYRWITVGLFIIGVVGIAANQLRVNRTRRDRWMDRAAPVDDGVIRAMGGWLFAGVAILCSAVGLKTLAGRMRESWKERLKVPPIEGGWVLDAKNWWIGLIAAAACLGLAFWIKIATGFEPFRDGVVSYGPALPIALLLVFGGYFLLPAFSRALGEREINYTQWWVQKVIAFPMMVTALMVAGVIWGLVLPGPSGHLAKINSYGEMVTTAWKYWPFPLTVVFASLALLSYSSVRTAKTLLGALAVVLAPITSVAVLHLLFSAIALLLQSLAQEMPGGEWHAFAWAPALVIYAFGLTVIALIGIVGRQSTEGAREWWSRLGAWLGIYGTAWMIVSSASVYGPFLVGFVLTWKWSAISGWLGSTLAGLLAGGSGSTGGPDTQKKSTGTQIKELIAVVAPFVFIAGLLVVVAFAVHTITRLLSGIPDDLTVYWYQLQWNDQHADWNFIMLGGSLALLGLFASRVDINEFSLNAFYRSRLVRCYLGASRAPEARHPQNFTNFDDDDDIALAKLIEGSPAGQLPGPFHIVNCALNLGGSSDLTVHTRHSANFTMTPLHCGSRYESREDPQSPAIELGYTNTKVYGSRQYQPTLGEAISISGAAASPNMGYHTSTVVAFLLTLFNVRLGWWLPTPDSEVATKQPSPWFSLHYLVTELFGLADDRSQFLAISDGGHFENLAVYELVKRRCKVIICGDAEQDPDLKFEGLGTLIRMCKVDFEATIDIDVASIGRDKSEWSHSRCAVGRIYYGGLKDFPEQPDEGIFIYIKASMTGHEDSAILQYKSAHETFPHESTGNQFYAEDQFESYRLLGKNIALTTFKPGIDYADTNIDVVAVAEKLFNVWSPTLRQVSAFTENSTRLMDMWADIGKRTDMKFLDPQLSEGWPKDPKADFREGFYTGSQMLQLMENVYLDLHLDETWDHADNKGWKQLFTVWSKSDVVKDTWNLSSETYGLRFRYFCNRELGLPVIEHAKSAGGGGGSH